MQRLRIWTRQDRGLMLPMTKVLASVGVHHTGWVCQNGIRSRVWLHTRATSPHPISTYRKITSAQKGPAHTVGVSELANDTTCLKRALFALRLASTPSPTRSVRDLTAILGPRLRPCLLSESRSAKLEQILVQALTSLCTRKWKRQMVKASLSSLELSRARERRPRARAHTKTCSRRSGSSQVSSSATHLKEHRLRLRQRQDLGSTTSPAKSLSCQTTRGLGPSSLRTSDKNLNFKH